MDETELIVPWEKQQRLLDPIGSDSVSSPVRKSYSYAGVALNRVDGGGSASGGGISMGQIKLFDI